MLHYLCQAKEGKCERCMMQNEYCICTSIQTIHSKSRDELSQCPMRFVVWMHHKAGAFDASGSQHEDVHAVVAGAVISSGSCAP